MLDELAVANLGIIESARIDPGRGLVVVTGETGTGKTLLLGALRLLLGETARKDQIGPHGTELTVEGRFVVGDDEMVAARRVTAARGRAYLDGAMVPSRTLAERLAPSVEIVGQHDALSLSDSAVIRSLVDGSLGSSGLEATAAYDDAWVRLGSLLAREAALGGDIRSIQREIEMLEYQADEIEDAGFEPGDDEELATRAGRLRNAGAIAEALTGASQSIDDDRGAIDRLGEVADALLRAARLDPSLEALAQQAGALVETAAALGGEVQRIAEDLDHDTGDLDDVERRLALLSDLRRKYGASLGAVLEFGAAARLRSEELRLLLDDSAGLADEIVKARSLVSDAGARLGEERMRVAAAIADRARAHLVDLGFSDPAVRFEFTTVDAAEHGTDRIVLLFASDASLTPAPVARAASGGELSRLVLSVRLAASSADVPVLAFDEIDAGLGGSTAYAMGSKLSALARERQVLCVTHLPQVAAFADEHFVIDREGTVATVRKVEGDERIDEVTRMLAGLAGSVTGRDHAAELIATAKG